MCNNTYFYVCTKYVVPSLCKKRKKFTFAIKVADFSDIVSESFDHQTVRLNKCKEEQFNDRLGSVIDMRIIVNFIS